MLIGILICLLPSWSFAQSADSTLNELVETSSLVEQLDGNTQIVQIERKGNYVGGWFFLVNLLILVVFVLRYFIQPNYSKKSWNAWVNQNLFFQFIREKQPLNFFNLLSGWLLRTYLAAIIIQLLLVAFTAQSEMTFFVFARLYLFVLIFFLVKMLVSNIIAFASDAQSTQKAVSVFNTIFIGNAAYFLLPLIFCGVYFSFFSKKIIILCIGIVILTFFMLYIIRGVNVLRKLKTPVNLHFFAYLCGLELMPYLILFKVLYNFRATI